MTVAPDSRRNRLPRPPRRRRRARARPRASRIYTRGQHGTAPERRRAHRRRPRRRHAAARPRAGTPRSTPPATTRRRSTPRRALDVGHYVFVSSCNAYPDWPDKPVDEDSPTWTGRRGLRAGQGRGRAPRARPRRRRRARRADRRPARQHLPAPVVGAADRRGRRRSPRPGDPDRPLQIIDARDLATFLLDLAEQRIAGAFNGTAPIGQTTMGELLRGRRATPSCAGSPTTSSRRPASSRGWSCRCGCRSASGTWHVGTEKAPGGGPAHAARSQETVADVATWLENGGEAELDDWRSEHRRRR